MQCDEDFMREALFLAENARGRTSPNPLVGAVIVRKGRLVGAGWHRKAGSAHAEIHALNMAGELSCGATFYVTLEPCSHHGRTGPCAEAIIKAGIRRVVVAMLDPNPRVLGKGKALLEEAGIEVKVGVLAKEAQCLNEAYIKWVKEKLPFVTLKTAMTLDGKIATAQGNSRWITSDAARQRVHEMRDVTDAIAVGIGTVLSDDPSLTTRLLATEGKNPLRVIIDSKARTPITAKVVSDGAAKTLIAVTSAATEDRCQALRARGAEVVCMGTGERVDLKALMHFLAAKDITSLLVEGGGTLNFSLLAAGLADKIHTFIAPKIVGGKNALTTVEGEGVLEISDAITLKNLKTEQLGVDILLTGYIAKGAK